MESLDSCLLEIQHNLPLRAFLPPGHLARLEVAPSGRAPFLHRVKGPTSLQLQTW